MINDPNLAELRRWLLAELDAARQAAKDARLHNARVRASEGPKAVHGARHSSAMARLCAFGETLRKIDELWDDEKLDNSGESS